MKTTITAFWNYFLSVQIDLIFAHRSGNLRLRDQLINKLYAKTLKINSQLRIILHFSPIETDGGKLIFLTRGNYKLNALAEVIISEAPLLDNWSYQIGIKPYKDSVVSLCANNKFIDPYTIVYQIYFSIEKVYRTSNKLHLIIYFEMDRKHSKHDLHSAMESIFLWFLGDALYHKHISRFRIVRRKYSAINFIPLDQIRNTIQFKSLN
jgi:hypothetical protein